MASKTIDGKRYYFTLHPDPTGDDYTHAWVHSNSDWVELTDDEAAELIPETR